MNPLDQLDQQIDLKGMGTNATGSSENLFSVGSSKFLGKVDQKLQKDELMQKKKRKEEKEALILSRKASTGNYYTGEKEEDKKEDDGEISDEQILDLPQVDYRKVMKFSLPKAEISFYDKSDAENPYVSFEKSNYFKKKKHLGGFLSSIEMKKLKQRIADKGLHRRDLYNLERVKGRRKD